MHAFSKFSIALTCLFFYYEQSSGQYSNHVAKSLGFDEQDTAIFQVPTAGLVAVYYKELPGRKLLRQVIDSEKKKDEKLKVRFPFAKPISQVSEEVNLDRTALQLIWKEVRRENKALQKLNQQILDSVKIGISDSQLTAIRRDYQIRSQKLLVTAKFHSIHLTPNTRLFPLDDYKIVNDSTLKLIFTSKQVYDKAKFKSLATYHSAKRIGKRKKVAKHKLIPSSNILQPNSRYAVIFLYQSGNILFPLLIEINEILENAPALGNRAIQGAGDSILSICKCINPLPQRSEICDSVAQTLYKEFEKKEISKELKAQYVKQQESSGIAFFDSTLTTLIQLYCKNEQNLKSLHKFQQQLKSTTRTTNSQEEFVSMLSAASRFQTELILDINTKDISTSNSDTLLSKVHCLIDLISADSAKWKQIILGKAILGSLLNDTDTTKFSKNIIESGKRLAVLQRNLESTILKYIDSTNISAGLISLRKYIIENWETPIIDSKSILSRIEIARKDIFKDINASNNYSGVIHQSTGTYVKEFTTRGKLSIVPDFGLVYYGFIPLNANKKFMSLAPYLGVHVNLRPYNKNTNFRTLPTLSPVSLHRWSLMLGFTLTSVAEDQKRKDFVGSSSLLLGGGYRIGGAIRIIAGGMFFRKFEKSPFSNQTVLGVTPFTGISIDLDLRDLFNNVFPFTNKLQP